MVPSMIPFWKYHGLGNDYLVVPRDAVAGARDRAAVARRLCDRHFGLGGDGVLFDGGTAGPTEGAGPGARAFVLEIYNPDGSVAEKSGNGLRIFARYLRDRARVGEAPFRVATLGGMVEARVHPDGRVVTVEMGRARFEADAIPLARGAGELLDAPLDVGGGRTVRASAVSMGNPHCVVLGETASPQAARAIGPLIECHPLFPNRTNVQLLEVVDRERLRIEIWERGAGYTLASGSSSCAAAAVARRLDLCDDRVTVVMPGGSLRVSLDAEFRIRLEGPVTKVAEGAISEECLEGTDG